MCCTPWSPSSSRAQQSMLQVPHLCHPVTAPLLFNCALKCRACPSPHIPPHQTTSGPSHHRPFPTLLPRLNPFEPLPLPCPTPPHSTHLSSKWSSTSSPSRSSPRKWSKSMPLGAPSSPPSAAPPTASSRARCTAASTCNENFGAAWGGVRQPGARPQQCQVHRGVHLRSRREGSKLPLCSTGWRPSAHRLVEECAATAQGGARQRGTPCVLRHSRGGTQHDAAASCLQHCCLLLCTASIRPAVWHPA